MSAISRRAIGLICALLLGLLFAPAGAASAADPVTVTAVADSYVSAAAPTTNYGNRLYFMVDGDPQQTAYLKFDIPAGTVLADGAKLRIYTESAHRIGVTVSRVTDTSWSETGITYGNRPAVSSGSVASGALSAGSWKEVDVSSLVSSTGLVSLAVQATNTTATKITSRQGVNKPQLVLGGGTQPPPGKEFVVSPVAGGPYRAASSTTTYTGSLKSVGERAVAALMAAGGGTVRFTAATFDFGTEYFKFTTELRNIAFEGAGIDKTIIKNNTDAAADTEPFNFAGTDSVKVRNMTVRAEGAPRTTSDALDFDKGNNSLVENVKITASRARGIVFDGKNAGWTANGNTVRGCVIDGVSGTGIEFLASSGNTVTGCRITNTGLHGIDIRLSSPSADQPNKKSNDNTITGNTIDEAGQHGIYVNTGDRNKILNNRITNSSDNATSRDGIRIASSVSGLGCDDNTVSGNTSIDNQATKTQTYGLDIFSAACHRTVVGAGQTFSPNRVGAVKDLGTGTVYQ